jgi:N-methylhydantoinase A
MGNKYYIGVDTGGTFTDCVIMDQYGAVVAVDKSPTVPVDPSVGVLDAVGLAGEKLGLSMEQLLQHCIGFVHGCTIATNAMLERKGSATGIITTKGHEDTILVGRGYQKRAGLSESQIIHESQLMNAHPPIVPRRWIKGISERVDYRGRVIVNLNEKEVMSAIDELANQGVKAAAVCFLWSFLNGDHERRVKEIVLSRYPEMFLVLSSDISPIMGEYERMVTTALSAYLGPNMSAYLSTLQIAMQKKGLPIEMLLMHSGGGVTSIEGVLLKPILLLDSGPTGGALGAQFFSKVYEQPNLICGDMGGTSFDVSLIINGEFLIEEMPTVAQYTFLTPKVKVESIGAGGGSIAWVDPDGILKVGPQSAGAVPGPACYDKGGKEVTVTDADLILGYLNPNYFWAGRMPLSRTRAEEAVGRIAAQMGMSILDTASGIVRIVNSQMADLIRKLTIETGLDHRKFTFFSFGGAGAVHASFIARELGINKVCIPASASVFAALGMCVGDMVHSIEKYRFFKFPLSKEAIKTINDIYLELEGKLRGQFDTEGIPLPKVKWIYFMYLRYGGQVHEVSITVPPKELQVEDQETLVQSFEKRYEEVFGSGSGYMKSGVEVLKYRVEGRYKRVLYKGTPSVSDVVSEAGAARKGRRQVIFERKAWDTELYDWSKLKCGARMDGPAIVEREGDTIIIPPFAEAEVDKFYNIWIHLNKKG